MSNARRWLCALLALALLSALAGAAAEGVGFDDVMNYFYSEGYLNDGRYLLGMKSLTEDGGYLFGAERESDSFVMYYMADDKTTQALTWVSRDGQVTLRITLRTEEESVLGDITFAAADYLPGQLLDGFSYTSQQRSWRYENFNQRASDAFSDLVTYAGDFLRVSDLVGLASVGFTQMPEERMWPEEITGADLAGIYLCEQVRCGLCLMGDEALEWSWSGGENPVTLDNLETYRSNMLASESLTLGEYDFALGKRCVTTQYQKMGSHNKPETLRWVACRDADGKLCLRIQSVKQGMGSPKDNLVYVKVEDAPWRNGVYSTGGSAPSENGGSYSASPGDSQALRRAKEYLNVSAFSRQGLIEQLEYEGYSHSEAERAVDQCGADWFDQAVKKAKQYLKTSAFSYQGLVDQLEFEGFTYDQATHGADRCGADWYEQAARKARQYLDYSSFSRQSLISQLEYEGFTHDQAVYGADHS